MTGLETTLVAGGFAVLLGSPPLSATRAWTLENFIGNAWQAETGLLIRQRGQPDIMVEEARYKTMAFEEAPYYAFRLGRWKHDRAWEVEVNHHKLQLINTPPEVQRFNVSHGYNFVLVERAWARLGYVFRTGIGPIIAHPETIIRNQPRLRGRGYLGFETAGIGALVGVETRVWFWGPFHLAGELTLQGAGARVTVADGYADVPNLAVHGRLGLGANF